MDNLVVADPAGRLGRDTARRSPFFRGEFAAGLRTFGLIMLTTTLSARVQKGTEIWKAFPAASSGEIKIYIPGVM
jgi:hypothetical protein